MVTRLHLHFPGGIPVSFLLLVQLCCVSDFVPFALFLSLKCSELSTTKHQRPLQANSNSGSGVRSPTCLTTATPATSCVTCDVLSAFHSDLLVGESRCPHTPAVFRPNIKLTGLVPSHAFNPLLRRIPSFDIHDITTSSLSLKEKRVPTETIASASHTRWTPNYEALEKYQVYHFGRTFFNVCPRVGKGQLGDSA